MDLDLATTIAAWFVRGLGVYVLAGAMFAVVFHLGGLRRIDAAATSAGIAFRILVTPGLVALWPLFLGRLWRGGGRLPIEHNAHRDASARSRGASQG